MELLNNTEFMLKCLQHYLRNIINLSQTFRKNFSKHNSVAIFEMLKVNKYFSKAILLNLFMSLRATQYVKGLLICHNQH